MCAVRIPGWSFLIQNKSSSTIYIENWTCFYVAGLFGVVLAGKVDCKRRPHARNMQWEKTRAPRLFSGWERSKSWSALKLNSTLLSSVLNFPFCLLLTVVVLLLSSCPHVHVFCWSLCMFHFVSDHLACWRSFQHWYSLFFIVLHVYRGSINI